MEAYKRVIWGSTIIAAIVALLMAGYFFFYKKSPPPPSSQVQEESQEERQVRNEPPAVSEPAPWLPSLDVELNQSDSVIREVVNKISDHPALPGWIKAPDLIRRFVAVVDNVAGGESPAPHLQQLRPIENFSVIKKGEAIYIDPESYKRYNLATSVFISMDNQKIAELFMPLTPLLNEAYQELGYPNGEFKPVMARAIGAILAVPIEGGDIPVVEKVMSYAFQDPKLERLSPVQKHLLRMGPQNLRRIQEKLRQLTPLLQLDQ